MRHTFLAHELSGAWYFERESGNKGSGKITSSSSHLCRFAAAAYRAGWLLLFVVGLPTTHYINECYIVGEYFVPFGTLGRRRLIAY